MEVYSLLVSFEDVSPVEKMVIIYDPPGEIRLKSKMFFKVKLTNVLALTSNSLKARLITWLSTEMWSMWKSSARGATNLLQRQDFPMPIDPFSRSPPERPTTHIVMSLLGPPIAAESPLLRVRPPAMIPS